MFELKMINNCLSLISVDKLLSIDFASNSNTHRRKQGGKEMIAKACGLHKYPLPLTILDTTAGLGNDAFILASLGCKVHLCEANDNLYYLLKDAIARALLDPEINHIIQNMHLYHGNSLNLISKISKDQNIDVIYFDPMFPKSNKSALPKQNMQILQTIAIENNLEQEKELLHLAQQYAHKRVVVKRHKNSPFFANCKAHASIVGKTNRFDLYMTSTP